MKLSKKRFEAMLDDLASRNHKVRIILNAQGGKFSKVPKIQQQLILNELGVDMKVVTTTTYTLKNPK